MERVTYFADVLLPLPLSATFTYRIPVELEDRVLFGVRVVVPFGKNKLLAGIVTKKHTQTPQIQVKYMVDVLDDHPIITAKQFELWQWLADYYLCTLGEVMAAALPSALKLSGESSVTLDENFNGDISFLTPNELHIVEIVNAHQTISLSEVAKISGIAKIFPIINSLVEKLVLKVVDEIKDPYKPKTESLIFLSTPYQSETELLKVIDELERSKRNEKQVQLLLGFFALLHEENKTYSEGIKKQTLLKKAQVSVSSLQTLLKNKILEEKSVKSSRLLEIDPQFQPETINLTELQEKKFHEIKEKFQGLNTVLLHGVTGSGKTEIYMKLIEETLAEGKQVLYLLPEIALTSQIINRLRKFFGTKVGVYHSRFNEFERVEIWNRVLNFGQENQNKYSLVLGARSALLLPYQNLGLIIVDEEHDGSYKQQDPAPRYQARDSAIVLAGIHKGKTLLGTATPSLESYHNAKQGKFGLVQLKQRFSQNPLPEIWVENLVEAQRQKKMTGHFSKFLIDNIAEALSRKEQVILFQNRRGYAVRQFCNTCQTMPTCIHCDVTLTYHKRSNLLKCHYCGYAIEVPHSCPNCGSPDIEMKGFGTERIEETLELLFPDAVVDRMDMDTTRAKNAYQRIINNFENHKTDILVGTQMVTKGLDFDRVSVVGILEADNLISYPDFRSFERAFQIMSQVSGRAGRKDVPGKVIIQTYQPWHPALRYVVSNNYLDMYLSQMEERKLFHYPPLYRLIKVTVKYNDLEAVNKAAQELKEHFSQHFSGMFLGPEFPLVSKIQNYYLKDFWLKFPKDSTLMDRKKTLKEIISQFQTHSPYKKVRIIINVDC